MANPSTPLLYQRYGVEHAAIACTYVTYRSRSAVRDVVGQALGLPEVVLSRGVELLRETAAPNESLALLSDLCRQLEGLPRHLGIHNGGMVITGAPLTERVPTEPATMPGRVVVQWDKESLETAGLIKIDLLGLRMLSAIAEAEQFVNAATGQGLNLDRLTFVDPAGNRSAPTEDWFNFCS